MRVAREANFLCGQCWAHFIASRGKDMKQFDMKAEQKGKISCIYRTSPHGQTLILLIRPKHQVVLYISTIWA